MVTTTTAYTDSRYRVSVGDGFDGIVRVSCNGAYGTGTLLYGGKAILTVAHLFKEGATAASQASILFATAAGTTTLAASGITIHPQYDAVNANNDLVLVWLSGNAPVSAERYTLYRESDELGQSLTLVGYGTPGTGTSGTVSNYSQVAKYQAMNQFDVDAGELKDELGEGMAWSPLDTAILAADFDSGLADQDALGKLANISDSGLGLDEGLIAPGDSGGPAFIDGKLAGVASYTAALSFEDVTPDIDTTSNSSFGEIGFWHRISAYQQWIDESLQVSYSNAPTTPDQVQKTVAEGSSGTQYAYFLLQFSGVRTDDNAWLSVDYATRDGTAQAGSDYVMAAGTLILYPEENQAVIPVEIIGDTSIEPDETFYLDITNPVGGSFNAGEISIMAMRIIQNDDFS